MSTSDAQDIADLKREVRRQGELIDDLYRRLGEPAPAPGPSATVPAAITDALRAGKLPVAMKLWHERNGGSLGDAKKQVEEYARSLGL
ncbi:hypothetical protein [Williamsia soli]|uniref:hypothetical protein n=1 Tax=Williamsia soli TaxID=364929 RepID=UPI001A9EFC48|nr:hypothetical protein [Williamsia soli]